MVALLADLVPLDFTDCSAQVKEKAEYMYYSISSTSHSFNPLYRMDISSRETIGMCVEIIAASDNSMIFLFA